jgi:hypothetical protein
VFYDCLFYYLNKWQGGRVQSSELQGFAVWRQPDILEEGTYSMFKVEDYAKQETSRSK